MKSSVHVPYGWDVGVHGEIFRSAARSFFALKGRERKAQGIALGPNHTTHEILALKGRNRVSRRCPVPPFQGGQTQGDPRPQAMPWAFLSRPFRAKKAQRVGLRIDKGSLEQ